MAGAAVLLPHVSCQEGLQKPGVFRSRSPPPPARLTRLLRACGLNSGLTEHQLVQIGRSTFGDEAALRGELCSLLQNYDILAEECSQLFDSVEIGGDGERMLPGQLYEVTQRLIFGLGGHDLLTLGRVAQVYEASVARCHDDGLGLIEFRGHIAAVLTQLLHELEGRVQPKRCLIEAGGNGAAGGLEVIASDVCEAADGSLWRRMGRYQETRSNWFHRAEDTLHGKAQTVPEADAWLQRAACRILSGLDAVTERLDAAHIGEVGPDPPAATRNAVNEAAWKEEKEEGRAVSVNAQLTGSEELFPAAPVECVSNLFGVSASETTHINGSTVGTAHAVEAELTLRAAAPPNVISSAALPLRSSTPPGATLVGSYSMLPVSLPVGPPTMLAPNVFATSPGAGKAAPPEKVAGAGSSRPQTGVPANATKLWEVDGLPSYVAVCGLWQPKLLLIPSHGRHLFLVDGVLGEPAASRMSESPYFRLADLAKVVRRSSPGRHLLSLQFEEGTLLLRFSLFDTLNAFAEALTQEHRVPIVDAWD